MNQNALKKQAAMAALNYIEQDMIVGIGSGSTVNYFIEGLSGIKHLIDGAVAASSETEARLVAAGVKVYDLNAVGPLPIYIDGADEFDDDFRLVKGGGGALTREKIVASASERFICIVDETKRVQRLGDKFPIPIEVIPMGRSYVARELVKMGANPEYREHVKTDNENVILDAYGLEILSPLEWEQRLNGIVGVVCHGLFASRCADVILLATEQGVKVMPHGSAS